jgi:hypothetical protein
MLEGNIDRRVTCERRLKTQFFVVEGRRSIRATQYVIEATSETQRNLGRTQRPIADRIEYAQQAEDARRANSVLGVG